MRQGKFFQTMLAALLTYASAGNAHHDDISDPPPLSSSHHLPSDLRFDADSVTVSGLSSGGFFAHQFHIAFSSLVTGAGILAGGPYGCVEVIDNPFWPFKKLDKTSAAVVACTHTLGSRFWGLRPKPPTANDVHQLIDATYKDGEIDDPANLANDRVWLFRGELDAVVPEAVAGSLADLYSRLGVDDAALHVEMGDPDRPVNHGMPVDSFSGESRFPPRDCEIYEVPFVIECGYDAAGLMLRHLYPETFVDVPEDPHDAGSLHAFDQTAFYEASASAGLSGVGYIYVPNACRSNECRLHVAFHGCRQNVDAQGQDRIHDDFIRDAGYNRWAAANMIVVLYPQATAAAGNPRACWDFWGYSGDEWRTRDGVQMRAVNAMINQLLDR